MILAVEMRDVSAFGVCVACADTMLPGARVVIRAADAVSGVEYVLPCSVAWVHCGAPNTIALVVDGIPSRKNFFSPIDAQARSALAMGRHQRLVGRPRASRRALVRAHANVGGDSGDDEARVPELVPQVSARSACA